MEWFTQQVIDICRSDKRVTSAKTVLMRCLEDSMAEAVEVCKSFEGLEAWTELPVSAIHEALVADKFVMNRAEAALALAKRAPTRGLEALAMEMNYFVQDFRDQVVSAEFSREIQLEESWHCLPSEMPDDY